MRSMTNNFEPWNPTCFREGNSGKLAKERLTKVYAMVN